MTVVQAEVPQHGAVAWLGLAVTRRTPLQCDLQHPVAAGANDALSYLSNASSVMLCSFLQSTTRVKPFICTMPMRLDEGWNQIQFNLSDFTRRAYGTNYVETLRVQIHANCRIRRIYFSDRLYTEEELPTEFKLFLPVQKQAQQAQAALTMGGGVGAAAPAAVAAAPAAAAPAEAAPVEEAAPA